MIKKAQNFGRKAIHRIKRKKSDYNVFDLLLVGGLFSFCPSLTLFSFPASLYLHYYCQPFNLSASVHKNVSVYFIFFFLRSVPHIFHNFPLVLFFFFTFLLLFPSPGTQYYKNDCNKSVILISTKKDAKSAMFTLSYLKFFVHVFSLFPLLQTLMDITSWAHTQILDQLATIWRDYSPSSLAF